MGRTTSLRPASFAEIQAAADSQQSFAIITRLQEVGVSADRLTDYVARVAQGEGSKVLDELTGNWVSLVATTLPEVAFSEALV